MQHDILFYSKRCKYSMEVTRCILDQGMKSRFVFICIDNRPSLPSFVDRVPLIFTRTRQVLTDDKLMRYVQGMDLAPYMGGCARGYSDAFSFIEDDEMGNIVSSDQLESGRPDVAGTHFTYINDIFDPIITSEEDKSNNGDSSGSKLDSSVFEKYISQRENDLKIIMNQGGI